jgi:hypothetical protein
MRDSRDTRRVIKFALVTFAVMAAPQVFAESAFNLDNSKPLGNLRAINDFGSELANRYDSYKISRSEFSLHPTQVAWSGHSELIGNKDSSYSWGREHCVPCPPSLALLASGLLGLIGVARRKVRMS